MRWVLITGEGDHGIEEMDAGWAIACQINSPFTRASIEMVRMIYTLKAIGGILADRRCSQSLIFTRTILSRSKKVLYQCGSSLGVFCFLLKNMTKRFNF